jgi:hypothetical protein
MKLTFDIPVTTVRRVEIVPNQLVSWDSEPELFDKLREFILSKEFHSSSCAHDEIENFFSHKQGGINHTDIIGIRFLGKNTHVKTWSFIMRWDWKYGNGEYMEEVLIVKEGD